MKHYVKPECRHKCRFLQISDGLWLCKHMAYGEATHKKGALEEARRLLERSGGYDAVLVRIQNAEEQKREAAREKQKKQAQKLAQSVRFE
jgi:hypothetical protein